MSDKYNLDEVAEYFEFILGGNSYRMRYPTTEEVEAGSKLKEGSTEQMDWIYGFVTPVKSDAPSIKEALAKVNIKTLQKFQVMLTTEFSAEE